MNVNFVYKSQWIYIVCLICSWLKFSKIVFLVNYSVFKKLEVVKKHGKWLFGKKKPGKTCNFWNEKKNCYFKKKTLKAYNVKILLHVSNQISIRNKKKSKIQFFYF